MPPSAATRKTAPKMVARERVFVLRWKICDMVLLENWVETRRILRHACTDARYREKILRSSFSRLFMRLAIINTSSGFCRAWERKNLKNFLIKIRDAKFTCASRYILEVANAGS